MDEKIADKKREELQKNLAKAKEELKEYDSKFTFSGLYKKVCGRGNVLKAVKTAKENANLTDLQLYEKGIVALKKFVAGLYKEE